MGKLAICPTRPTAIEIQPVCNVAAFFRGIMKFEVSHVCAAL
jgi:hypothetical protein